MSVRKVQKNGRAHWRVHVIRRSSGYRRTRFLDRRDYSKARADEIEREMEIEAESWGDALRGEAQRECVATSPTFSAVAGQFLDVQDPSTPDARNKRSNLELHILPYFGGFQVQEITALSVEQFAASLRQPQGPRAVSKWVRQTKPPYASKRRKGGAKSTKTIRNILTTLRTVLRRAKEWGFVHDVPLVRLPREPISDPDFLTFDELDAFLLGVEDTYWRDLFLVAARTGLRLGELQELRGIDLRNSESRMIVRVSRQWARQRDGAWEVRPPKGKRPRSVPLAKDALEVLQQRRRSNQNLLFPGPLDGRMDQGRIYRACTRFGRACGVAGHVNPHRLRHTFASHCAIRGIPLMVIQSWMGHADYRTTLRYAHLAPTTGEDLIDLIE